MSTLLDILEMQCLEKRRYEEEKKDEYGFGAKAQAYKEELRAALSDELKEKLKWFESSLCLLKEGAYHESDKMLLLTGIKIGMELQKAFDEEE